MKSKTETKRKPKLGLVHEKPPRCNQCARPNLIKLDFGTTLNSNQISISSSFQGRLSKNTYQNRNRSKQCSEACK